MVLNSLTIAHPSLGMVTEFDANFGKAVTRKVEAILPNAVDEFVSRAGKEGQFLSWPGLPKQQLARVNEIYDMVDILRAQTEAKVLTVLGIGGSKHTVEHMLGINGLNLKGDKVKFFSDIDSTSFNRFLQQIDGDVTKSNYLVASKSGSTFETKDGMNRIMDMLKAKFTPTDACSNVERYIAQHMVAVTDQNADKSELRRLSDKNNWLGKLYIHDDVGGRFSALDDHSLFTLAWAGMKKADMIEMLKGADEMSNIAVDKNIRNNTPLMQAAYWTAAKFDGIKNSVHQYLGEMFNSTERWHAQMQNESMKDTAKQIAKITDAMHHSSEAWYKLGNKFAFALTAPSDKGVARENVDGYIDAIRRTNEEYGPSMLEILDTKDLGLTPEAAGAMTQARAFSTVYQEIIEKQALNQPLPKVLDSVLQPNVEEYKKNLKPIEGNQPPVVAGRISINA